MVVAWWWRNGVAEVMALKVGWCTEERGGR